MNHLFYIMICFPLYWELINLYQIKKTYNFIIVLKAKKANNLSGKEKVYIFFSFGYLTWSFIGLFSSQWPIFLFLLLMGLIPKYYIWWRWIDSFLSFVGLLFILLNAYHFNIDVYKLILTNF